MPPKPALLRRPLLLAGLLVVALVFIGGIAVLTVQVVRQIDAQATAQSDSGQWTLSQLDVEALTLQLALQVVALAPPQTRPARLADLRQRFDIFYSRVTTLRRSSLTAGLRQLPVFQQEMQLVEDFANRVLPLIDGDDAALLAGLERLSAEIGPVRKATRIVSLTGLEILANRSDAERAGVRRTLILAAGLTMALVLVLLALVAALWRLERSNHRRAEETQTALTRMAAIVGAAHDAVIVADRRGRIVDFNAAAAALFGYGRDEALGADVEALIVPESLRAADADGLRWFDDRPGALNSMVGRGRQRLEARHRDGRLVPVEFSVSVAGTGPQGLFVAFLRDMSADVEAARALTQARDDALAGEKAKAELLVVMSHEMRTPLNGLIGTLDLLGTSDLGAEQRAHHAILTASAQLLLHHVNNVLDITRLDRGMMPVHLEAVDLGDIATGMLANQQAAAQEQGTWLSLSLPPPDRRRVMADAGQLRQLLLNLIGNAVKFTRNGTIAVEISHLGPAGPTRFAIIDSGIGIAPADLARVFEDFVTLDASYARTAGGTGLGLGIVRRIVESLGGALTAESRPGEGSRFSFDLPLMILSAAADLPAPIPAPAPVPLARPKPRQNGLRLLLVEDNSVNRVIARTMLLRDGHEVTEAHDGEEAVRLAAALRFDAVLMDISMPGLDGLQATRAIRSGQGQSRESPIIALTAHALAEEVERFRSGGMRDVLIKPLTRASLSAALAGLAAPVPETPAAALVRREVVTALREDMGADQAGQLIDQFLTQSEATLDRLAASPAPSPEVFSRELHKIAGAASLFGASRLNLALAEILTACKSGDAAAPARLPALRRLWAETAAAYRLA